MAEDESKLAEKLESATKFTEEELNKIEAISTEYVTIQRQFGQLGVNKIRLQQSLEAADKFESQLQDRFVKNQETETEFLGKITEKYGEGSLNPETGEFTPNNPDK